jgi:hypothetical protein
VVTKQGEDATIQLLDKDVAAANKVTALGLEWA